MKPPAKPVVLVCAALASADLSIATLALPSIMRDLDASFYGAAAVHGLYAAGAGLTLIAYRVAPKAILRPRLGAAAFALAAAACATAPSMTILLGARFVQGGAAAVVLLTAFATLAAEGQLRAWPWVSVFPLAVGPALGGALTQALDWRAIFALQIPLAASLIVAHARFPRVAAPLMNVEPADVRRPLALGLVSAASTGVLFLLVLELVAGWGIEPFAAAVTLLALAVAALGGSAVTAGAAERRAALGAVLLAIGTVAAAFLPDARAAWTIGPQVVAGFGIGLTLRAFIERLLPERARAEAARSLAVRNLGVVLAMVALAPLIAHDLPAAVRDAQLGGVALILDAEIDPLTKLTVASRLLTAVDAEQPRVELRSQGEAISQSIDEPERAGFEALRRDADELIVDAVAVAFKRTLLACALAALLAAALLAPRAAVAGVAATALVALGGSLSETDRPSLRDPCARAEGRAVTAPSELERDLLRRLDAISCRIGSTREELVLGIADAEEAEAYQRRYGVDPRSFALLLTALGS